MGFDGNDWDCGHWGGLTIQKWRENQSCKIGYFAFSLSSNLANLNFLFSIIGSFKTASYIKSQIKKGSDFKIFIHFFRHFLKALFSGFFNKSVFLKKNEVGTV